LTAVPPGRIILRFGDSLASQVSWPHYVRLRFFGHSLNRKRMRTNQALLGSRKSTSGTKLELLGHGCLSAVSVLCVLSGRGLCEGLITHPEQSYRAYCVQLWTWNLDNEEALGLSHHEKNVYMYIHMYVGKFVWIFLRWSAVGFLRRATYLIQTIISHTKCDTRPWPCPLSFHKLILRTAQ
jgi:hypothetical protein